MIPASAYQADIVDLLGSITGDREPLLTFR
jgi:hypothetical protein